MTHESLLTIIESSIRKGQRDLLLIAVKDYLTLNPGSKRVFKIPDWVLKSIENYKNDYALIVKAEEYLKTNIASFRRMSCNDKYEVLVNGVTIGFRQLQKAIDFYNDNPGAIMYEYIAGSKVKYFKSRKKVDL